MATTDGAQPRTVAGGAPFLTSPIVVPGGRYLLYTTSAASPFPAAAPAGAPGGGRGQAPAGGRGGQGGARPFALVSLADGTSTTFTGSSPDVSADGSVLAFVSQTGTESTVQVVKLGAKPAAPVVVKKSLERIASVSVSPDGSRVAYDVPYTRNTEIFTIKVDGTGEVRVSREIQPDRAPNFLTNTTLIAIKGEARHSRSYLYDLSGRQALRLFHNNTVRTIAPEYEWLASRDGQRLLIVAERDGDTISAQRGVYLVDLAKKVSRDDLVRRLDACLAAERDLRQRGAAMFQPMAAQMKALVDRVSITRIYGYESALFDFDSKYITQPGNQRAGEYIFETLKSFGYQPEYQWFTTRPRGAQQDVRTANILATLKGTANPDLVYVLSSHYDSNERGPGADDNSSAIAVLLETARIMARTPMPATIVFAAFTGEEAGLLGSREFVRQAVEKKVKLVGALNNDMIGWTNDHRLDNTIRYSNAGIRDLQHAASFLFSRMITYDARYFKSTDAQAYFDAYGDIVGGFGSYPVLGNPYYHQPTDLLETVNHQLLVEATKANLASIAGLASMPSRLTGVTAAPTRAGGVTVSWTPAPETGIVKYLVAFGPAGRPMAQTITVTTPRVVLPAPLKGGAIAHVAVKAVNARGLAAWDWASTTVAAAVR
jgi:Tol biopolymer transport system component